ncbi:energy transducer TonB [Helicobacter burdigaliensis]|uniref:energy transducer TonB n=1 Tax=Helicobacter burdigaliensis TaxID=2315334 RepID=UPI000EF640A0|nr:energy transducer TonB [Helicobacter burdigaliensis]
MQRRALFALFLSIFLHILVIFLILFEFPKKEFNQPKHGNNEGKRINIKDFKFSKGAQPQNTITPSNPQNHTPQTNKTPRIEEASKKQTPQKEPIKKEVKQPKKDPKKPLKENAKETQQELIKNLKNPTQQPKKLSSPSAYDIKPKNSSPSLYEYSNDMASQEIEELYGEELYSLSLEERKFIEDNLSNIGRITQKYLKYPEVAGKLGQHGDNVVEFYLHPNGDITDLRLLTPSGYRLLDDNSVKTIEIAYKDYPYPSVKTKIRIRVMYRIY